MIDAPTTPAPITVTGLSNGTSYTFTVTATNAAGTTTGTVTYTVTGPAGSSSLKYSGKKPQPR